MNSRSSFYIPRSPALHFACSSPLSASPICDYRMCRLHGYLTGFSSLLFFPSLSRSRPIFSRYIRVWSCCSDVVVVVFVVFSVVFVAAAIVVSSSSSSLGRRRVFVLLRTIDAYIPTTSKYVHACTYTMACKRTYTRMTYWNIYGSYKTWSTVDAKKKIQGIGPCSVCPICNARKTEIALYEGKEQAKGRSRHLYERRWRRVERETKRKY